MPRKTPDSLRSRRWFGPADLRSFGHRSRLKQAGIDPGDLAGRPVIAILNTWSELNPCHLHFRQRAEEVKRGVLLAGGFPVEVPALSVGETFMKPTSMLYRNLLAMEAEELLRANPIDGAVLLGGCDKTLPALIMGALSAGLPAIVLPAGPMLRGNWGGKTLGSGSDAWKYWDELRAGNIRQDDWEQIEGGIARSNGTCMTMGTASTMAAIAEVLGLTLAGASSVPAADSAHPRLATATGRRIVDLVWEDVSARSLATAAAFDNAVTTAIALGGSTNAVVHLLAMAGRAGVGLDLARFDAIARRTPVLANLRPTGQWLMEDFHYAGGLRAFLARIADLLDLSCRTVEGRTLGDAIEGARVVNDQVILPRDRPLQAEGGLAVLGGNLAPDGAVIKHAAMEQRFLRHGGPAVVFRDYDDLAARIDDPALEVTPDSVLVLQNAGPLGGPGMPEWGMLPIPKKLVAAGVRDMLRISDARMSGTSYGACVLHVAPESAIGGPLALVRSGDRIELDVPARRLTLQVGEAELAARRDAWTPPQRHYARGFGALYLKHVRQANEGCDFGFLEDGAATPDPEIH